MAERERPENFAVKDVGQSRAKQKLNRLSASNAYPCMLKLPGLHTQNTSTGQLRYGAYYIGFAPTAGDDRVLSPELSGTKAEKAIYIGSKPITGDNQILDPALAATMAGQALMDSASEGLRVNREVLERGDLHEMADLVDRSIYHPNEPKSIAIPVTEETIDALRKFFRSKDASRMHSVHTLETAILNSVPGLDNTIVQSYLAGADNPLKKAEIFRIQHEALETHYRARNREPNAYIHDFMNSLEPVIRCKQNDLTLLDITDAYFAYLEQSLVSVGLQEIGQDPDVDQSSLNRYIVIGPSD